MRRLIAAGLVLAAGAVTTVLTGQAPALGLDNGPASTPPMGWNGYNHFSRNVSAAIVEAEARALVTSGMKAAGYTYVNLDGGWDLMQRDAAGQLQANPALFPDGIAPVAAYVHSLGLRFGIYTSAGTMNCAGTTAGSYGHYQQDAETFASWGVDYVKFDYCNIPYQDYPGMTEMQVGQLLGTQMEQALTSTGRPMVFDINDASGPRNHDLDWTWAPGIANMWRVTSDIADSYTSMLDHFCGCAGLPPGESYDLELYQYASPGAWNDPDMLEVGNGGMTNTEDQTEFSLWAEMAAPLLAGNDLTTMPDATREILTNREVIAVDQDPLGQQGYAVQSAGGLWVLTKPLAGGDRAVVLFNQNTGTEQITTDAAQVGLPKAPVYLLRDLWQHTTSVTTGTISAAVPGHAVVMYRVSAPGAQR